MEKYGLNQLRKMFLDFFVGKDFVKLDSAPLIPHNDKSLLLINSGMAPLKPYFTGQETPPSKRVTTCQKCIRTPDIENVGKTARHGTFFEMLGNFSFGDYFKREAITWAWEFMTEVVKIDKELLYVTVYEDDDEAATLWHEIAGLEEKRIVRMGKEDNFWEIGTGPCGPCSEIYVDRGEKYGCGKPDCYVGCDCDRYVEVWNLVFTQFDKDDNGNYNRLAHPNIDTGMGLERLAVVCQGVESLFEVDTIRFVLDYITSLAGVKYHEDLKKDVSIRVITDHIRSVVFMLSDGVIPSNEGRGYVLRRLLRRAVRHGKLLGIEGYFLVETAMKVIETSAEAYPNLREHYETILRMIQVEEIRFNETINQGTELIGEVIVRLKKEGLSELSGSEAFKLYDTFGFPLELTQEIAEENGMSVDEAGFTQAMKVQKTTSSEAFHNRGVEGWKDEISEIASGFNATSFTGYDSLTGEGKILCLIKNNEAVESVKAGENFMFIVDTTPFYAQSGGQVGDIGTFSAPGLNGNISNTQKNGDKFIHTAYLDSGELKINDSILLNVNGQYRMNVQRNHTSTHLLHKALRSVLGSHVHQAGSEVSAEKLRFDFSHFEKMTEEQIRAVEKMVNEEILKCTPVEWFTTDINEAKSMGATALFGEKYGSNVRVVKIGDYSMELCGGCHLPNIAYAGTFRIISESGIAAGVRRIEALTGPKALEYIEKSEETIREASVLLKAQPELLITKLEELKEQNSSYAKQINEIKQSQSSDLAGDLFAKSSLISGVNCLVASLKDTGMDQLRDLCDKLRDKMGSGIVFLTSSEGEKGFMVCACTKDIITKGFNCGGCIKKVATMLGGGGGGKPDMAQAGIKNPAMAEKAAEIASETIRDML